MTHALFVRESANAKTGKIPVTYSQRSTCPQSCPHYRASCYAEGYHTALAWNRAANSLPWSELCEKIAALPTGTLWRHNVAGDLPGEGEKIDAKALKALVAANKGKKGFTYTHKKSAQAIRSIRAANRAGFTVNLSADDAGEADTLAELQAGPVVTIVPMDTPAKSFTPAGRQIVVCPAQTHDDVTCKTCGLCSRANRETIVGFLAHGTRAKMADATARRVIPLLKIEGGKNE
jgi:hypothetical protein